MTTQEHNRLEERLARVRRRISSAAKTFSCQADRIQLLAVSKTRHVDEIREAARLEQRAFGESYLQEALEKIKQLKDLTLEWHFIGRLQSNKTRSIAEHFDWVHSIASLKHAQRLSDQRPEILPPLKICIQVNTSGEGSKDGHNPDELAGLIERYANLPNLELRGLMTIPAPAETLEAQRRPFKRLRLLRDALRTENMPLNTLSMGMSKDLEAAIAEGSNLVRIGTAIFGPRLYNVKN
ncbi:MAG: YggS family pyridoxal phosphate-dependent enzyme [Pseudomonadota bacterium]